MSASCATAKQVRFNPSLSERRGAQAIVQRPPTQRRLLRAAEEWRLVATIIGLATLCRRYGSPQITALL